MIYGTIIGFTGTRKGMQPVQVQAVRWLLAEQRTHGAEAFHHGVCIGADAEAHRIADALGYRLVGHPPHDPKYRAKGLSFHVRMPAAEYLERDQNIVDAADVLIVAPMQLEEAKRSGTWATLRMAKRKAIPVYVVTFLGQVFHYGVAEVSWSGLPWSPVP